MRAEILIALALGVLGFAGAFIALKPSASTPASPATDIGQAAPQFTFTSPNGITKQLADFSDKIVILNFWASWCAPCIKEFPALLTAAQSYPDDVILLAISSDIDEAAMSTFIKRNKLPSAPNIFIALDHDQTIAAPLYQATKLPKTIIINQTQDVIHQFNGADWEYSDLAQQIEMLLGSIKNPS